MNDALRHKTQSVLLELVNTLFPTHEDAKSLVIEHVWRDREYVGEAQGQVAIWKGHSVNLGLLDTDYRAVFIDRVENVLDAATRRELFGAAFAERIAGIDPFVIGFVTGFKRGDADLIEHYGYTPRLLSRAAHGCMIHTIDDFLSTSTDTLVLRLIRLIRLQQHLERID